MRDFLLLCSPLAACHTLQYEPELFPGLIYRMRQPKIVLLIFVSGKIVLTGAKVRMAHALTLRTSEMAHEVKSTA